MAYNIYDCTSITALMMRSFMFVSPHDHSPLQSVSVHSISECLGQNFLQLNTEMSEVIICSTKTEKSEPKQLQKT